MPARSLLKLLLPCAAAIAVDQLSFLTSAESCSLQLLSNATNQLLILQVPPRGHQKGLLGRLSVTLDSDYMDAWLHLDEYHRWLLSPEDEETSAVCQPSQLSVSC
jgi:hypothetical protein